MAPAGLAALLCPAPALQHRSHTHYTPSQDVWKLGGGLSYGAAAAAVAAARSTATTVVKFTLPVITAHADATPAPVLSGTGSSWGSGACPLGYGTGFNLLKTYPPVELPSTMSLLTPHKLLWLLLKNSGLVFLLRTNLWLYQALEAEEAALNQGTPAQLPPFPDPVQQLVRAGWNSVRELLTAITRSQIKHLVRARASARVAWKVLKEPRDSLSRKALFYASSPPWTLLPAYCRTMLRTSGPMYAAELLVACWYDAMEEAWRALAAASARLECGKTTSDECLAVGASSDSSGLAHAAALVGSVRARTCATLAAATGVTGGDVRTAARRWGICVARNALRVSGTALAAAVGAAAAGALAPRDRAGVWAVRGHIVTDLLVANLLLLLLDGSSGLGFGPSLGMCGAAPAGVA